MGALIIAAPNSQPVVFALNAAAAVAAWIVVSRVDRRLDESLRRRAIAANDSGRSR